MLSSIPMEKVKTSLLESFVTITVLGIIRGGGDPSQIYSRESLWLGVLLAAGALIVRLLAPQLLQGYQGGMTFLATAPALSG